MTQRIFTPFFPLLFLLSFPWAAHAQQPESVSLEFGWPDGFTAYVEQEWTKITQTPDRADTGHVVSTYRMRGLKHDEGLLIRKDSFDLSDYPRKEHQDIMIELQRQAQEFLPDYVVSPRGEFLHLENLAQKKAVFDSIFGPQIVRQRMSRLILDTMFSGFRMQTAYVHEWDELVGFWSGKTLEIGVPYRDEFRQPNPNLPSIETLMKRTTVATRWVDCNPESEGSRCLELVVTVQPDSASMMESVRELAEMFEMPEVMAMIRTREYTQTTTLVCDPGTLIPYSLTRTFRSLFIQHNPRTNREMKESQQESRIFRFRYEAARE